MNKLCQLFLLIVIVLSNQSWAQKVQVDFDYATFTDSKTGPYVETYLSFNGDSLHYNLTEDSTLVALMEVTMLFKNADKIKEYRKFKVASAELPDTATIFENVVNKQRVNMPNGIYNFDIIVKDFYGGDTIVPFKHKELITVDFPKDVIKLGGIELLDKHEISRRKNIYKKGEYECVPFVSCKYSNEQKYLKVYTELYNAAKEIGPLETFFFLFHIEKVNTGKPIKGFSYFEKQKAYNSNTVYKELRIANLPTGNYLLTVEIQDSLNRSLLSTKKFFAKQGNALMANKTERNNIEVANTFVDKLNPDKLTDYIKGLAPICDASEMQFIDSLLNQVDLHTKKQFFLNFWHARDKEKAESQWLSYKIKLDSVQNKFSQDTIEGYLTDKGRIMLVYGVPNEIGMQKLNNGTEAVVWHYYKLWDQTNISFTFSLEELPKLIDTNLKWEKWKLMSKKQKIVEITQDKNVE